MPKDRLGRVPGDSSSNGGRRNALRLLRPTLLRNAGVVRGSYLMEVDSTPAPRPPVFVVFDPRRVSRRPAARPNLSQRGLGFTRAPKQVVALCFDIGGAGGNAFASRFKQGHWLGDWRHAARAIA